MPNQSKSNTVLQIFVLDLRLCSAWDMGYEGDMGYGTNFPAYRDGISENVWGIRE